VAYIFGAIYGIALVLLSIFGIKYFIYLTILVCQKWVDWHVPLQNL